MPLVLALCTRRLCFYTDRLALDNTSQCIHAIEYKRDQGNNRRGTMLQRIPNKGLIKEMYYAGNERGGT